MCEQFAIEEAVREEAELEQLRTRGVGCGLAEFLAEVANELLPALRRG